MLLTLTFFAECLLKNVWIFVYAMSVGASPKQALRLVGWRIQCEYIVKAILGWAFAVAKVIWR
jgi:hypothetical protein